MSFQKQVHVQGGSGNPIERLRKLLPDGRTVILESLDYTAIERWHVVFIDKIGRVETRDVFLSEEDALAAHSILKE